MSESYKIRKISAADLVCDKMKELIINQTWPTGQKIPTEMELSSLFGVNRLTVRIATQRLQSLGLLDIRVGDGTYIKKFDLGKHLAELSDFYVGSKTVQDVVEFRMMFELPCARMAAERRTKQELDTFQTLCTQFSTELDQFYANRDRDDAKAHFMKTVDITVNLHMTLCEMTHNELIQYAFILAKEPLYRHMRLNALRRVDDLGQDQTNVWIKRWQTLCDALRKRDAQTSETVLRQIIDS